MNKKVLIITYYWPPSGGSGVQRWLKFVKYLPSMGWEPIVFTPENPSFTIRDESLQKEIPDSVEVIKLPIWEPYDIFFTFSRFFGKKAIRQSDFISTEKKSLFQKISIWIRGNFFIPDARIFWVRPSVNFLEEFIKSNEIETVITTGPPHSIHLIGLQLKKKINTLKWVADFRDPWSEWDLLDTLSLTSIARRVHQKKERKVLTSADRIITISPFHVTRLEELSGRKVDLLTNGFDVDDFASVKRKRTSQFTLRHIGMVDELRDPRPILQSVRELCEIETGFAEKIKVEFIGNVNSAFRKYVADDRVLKSVVSFRDTIPHDQLLQLYGETDVQLLVLAHTTIAPGNLPGKLFEYLASGNSILGIGPTHGDAAVVLKETNAGIILERVDNDGIKDALMKFYSRWRDGNDSTQRDVSVYSRENLTRQLVSLLNSL